VGEIVPGPFVDVALPVPLLVDLVAPGQNEFRLVMHNEDLATAPPDLIDLSDNDIAKRVRVFVVDGLTLDLTDPLIQVLLGADNHPSPECCHRDDLDIFLTHLEFFTALLLDLCGGYLRNGVLDLIDHLFFEIDLDVALLHIDDDVIVGLEAIFLFDHHAEDESARGGEIAY